MNILYSVPQINPATGVDDAIIKFHSDMKKYEAAGRRMAEEELKQNHQCENNFGTKVICWFFTFFSCGARIN